MLIITDVTEENSLAASTGNRLFNIVDSAHRDFIVQTPIPVILIRRPGFDLYNYCEYVYAYRRGFVQYVAGN